MEYSLETSSCNLSVNVDVIEITVPFVSLNLFSILSNRKGRAQLLDSLLLRFLRFNFITEFVFNRVSVEPREFCSNNYG